MFLKVPEGKRQLGRPICRRVDYITANFVMIGLGVTDWIDLVQDGNQ
jgi:hypothetical protein